MTSKAHRFLEDSPIIAAIKNDNDLTLALETDCKIIFILYGTVCNIEKIVSAIKNADKIAMVHLDLITGLASKEISVSFIKEFTKADGIISTKPALVKFAKELGFITVQRVKTYIFELKINIKSRILNYGSTHLKLIVEIDDSDEEPILIISTFFNAKPTLTS